MPPVPQARLLADCADQIRHLASYLQKGGSPELAYRNLHKQLENMKQIHSNTVFTSMHSYKNLNRVRTALANAAASIEANMDKLEDLIYKLEENPRDREALMALALMAPELKSIRFAPPLRDEAVQTVSPHSRIPVADNLSDEE
jgi:hypothetical protein